jgi:hypothetical protein
MGGSVAFAMIFGCLLSQCFTQMFSIFKRIEN